MQQAYLAVRIRAGGLRGARLREAALPGNVLLEELGRPLGCLARKLLGRDGLAADAEDARRVAARDRCVER